jgi:hypothetical protein
MPNLLRNIFEALVVDGIVIHHSPTNNFVDHGFYQFSPTLSVDYYSANGFADIDVSVARIVNGVTTTKTYHSGLLADLPAGGRPNEKYSTFGTRCTARKLATTTFDRIPQQGEYLRVLGDFASPAPSSWL